MIVEQIPSIPVSPGFTPTFYGICALIIINVAAVLGYWIKVLPKLTEIRASSDEAFRKDLMERVKTVEDQALVEREDCARQMTENQERYLARLTQIETTHREEMRSLDAKHSAELQALERKHSERVSELIGEVKGMRDQLIQYQMSSGRAHEFKSPVADAKFAGTKDS